MEETDKQIYEISKEGRKLDRLRPGTSVYIADTWFGKYKGLCKKTCLPVIEYDKSHDLQRDQQWSIGYLTDPWTTIIPEEVKLWAKKSITQKRNRRINKSPYMSGTLQKCNEREVVRAVKNMDYTAFQNLNVQWITSECVRRFADETDLYYLALGREPMFHERVFKGYGFQNYDFSKAIITKVEIDKGLQKGHLPSIKFWTILINWTIKNEPNKLWNVIQLTRNITQLVTWMTPNTNTGSRAFPITYDRAGELLLGKLHENKITNGDVMYNKAKEDTEKCLMNELKDRTDDFVATFKKVLGQLLDLCNDLRSEALSNRPRYNTMKTKVQYFVEKQVKKAIEK